ncbi:MAG: hypothetical protein ACUVXJ_12915 [Phycisphaerae bacterium]
MLDAIFQCFADQSPITVMAGAALARLLSAPRLDALFEKALQGQYAHQLLFSTVFGLMATVVAGTRRSIHHAYQTATQEVGVSVVAALRGAHGAHKIEQEVSDYYIAAELETTSRGMMIAIPQEHWDVFGQMSPEEFVDLMLLPARRVNLRHFRKHPRGPKKKPLPRSYDPAHPHVSTARILAQRQTRKRRKNT